MSENIILLTDSYKVSHWKQYPPGTEKVYSYFESRGGDFERTVFFGLQYFLKRYLEPGFDFLNVIRAKQLYDKHLGPGIFNEAGWNSLLKKHNGKLPISIKALPEGSVVQTGNALMTIENTDPEFYWLTNYLETLLVQTWYPTTVATISFEMKRLILKYLEDTGTPTQIGFKLHDFGFRGVSSVESAGIGGLAHLVNFWGTDTVEALAIGEKYYGEECAGFSIPAAEHSTITSWGKENEAAAYENMLTQYSEGLVAVVSDSYNIYEACEKIWGGSLKDRVLNRKGTVVIRPDSGVPHEVVVDVLRVLSEKFGVTVNDKGYKVLPDQVRVIQGDGIDLQETKKILEQMKIAGFSADNIAFGMGGALLQKLNRDTQKFAFKCSSITINGKDQEVFKSPVGADWKASKRGKLRVIQYDRTYLTSGNVKPEEDALVEVFRDGKLLVDYSLDEIRKRATNGL